MNLDRTLPFLERYTCSELRGSIANMDFEAQTPRWHLVLVSLLTCVVGMAVGLTPDGLALIEFKSALTAISPLLEDWNASDASPCSWGGINCTDSGRVRNISLSAQEPMLEGNISASLGKLEFLEGLVLDQNMLSGSIPPELGNLSRLRMLSLYTNSLTGEIPPELGNCSSLGYLSLFNNSLSGQIPEVIYKNLNLTLFDVSLNNLSGDITTGMTSFHPALCCLGCFSRKNCFLRARVAAHLMLLSSSKTQILRLRVRATNNLGE
jgi:Leucine-rich repeat (LRR) protein